MSCARHQCWNHPETGTIVSDGLCLYVYCHLTNTDTGLALKYGAAILQSLMSFLQHASVSHLKECRLRGGGSFQEANKAARREANSALPRRRRLWMNSKKARYKGKCSWEMPR
jgi:hypothetical protein